MTYPKITTLSRVIPFFAILDMISTLLAFLHGAHEYGFFASFFVVRWGVAGLVIYACLLFIIMYFSFNSILIRAFETPVTGPSKKLTVSQSFLLFVFYIVIPSYWVGFVISANFAFAFYPQLVSSVQQYAPLVACIFIFLYLKKDILNIHN